jgi:hypothetical protein
MLSGCASIQLICVYQLLPLNDRGHFVHLKSIQTFADRLKLEALEFPAFLAAVVRDPFYS